MIKNALYESAMYTYTSSISPVAQKSKMVFDIYTENQIRNVLTLLMGLTLASLFRSHAISCSLGTH